jgi:hypothetical protein
MIPASKLRGSRRHLRLIASQPSVSELPKTRGECRDGPRPCGYLTCRHHLALDVSFAGGVKVHWMPDEDPAWPTCSLDVADLGQHNVDETAVLLGCSRERVRQVEEQALRKLREPMAGER